MSKKRRMLLYRFEANGWGTLIECKDFDYTTLSHERQVADDFAAEYEMRQGDGYIAIVSDKGVAIDKLDLQP